MSGTQDAGSDPIEDGSLEAFDIGGTDGGQEQSSEKPGGLGEDGTIPSDPRGVAAGHTGEQSTFEPEEDEEADV
ncbi:MAG TPA: hypothetical protein VFY91_11700 [Microbacterium sp.]|nr:hypothetical protein [Microbacterium sp.]